MVFIYCLLHIKNRLEEWIITKGKTKFYMIQSLNMANWLCSNGHKIIKVEDNTKNPNLKVFLFEDTIALRNTMKQFRKEV